MPKYTVRIELHDASWQNYADLAKHMAAQGMIDVIQADDGVRYKMPPAEYNYVGAKTCQQVLDAAKGCASRVVNSYAVLVTESNGRLWYGLPKVG